MMVWVLVVGSQGSGFWALWFRGTFGMCYGVGMGRGERK